MNESRVTLSINNHIATVSLNRPEKYNGLDLETLQALVRTAKAVKKNRDVRVVILRGEGKAFCAGLDFATVTKTPLKMLLAFTKFGVKKTNLFQQACWAWRELPVPVIAVLHGYCYGCGLQLALAAEKHAAALERLRVELTGSVEEQAAARAEAEKERRIEQLHKKAAARIGNQGLMRGWSGWHGQWEAAAPRPTRPRN